VEVGLSPSHTVKMGTQLPQKGHSIQFSAHVTFGQMAGWIKMPLGMELDLGPDHIALDGDPALPPKGAQLILASAELLLETYSTGVGCYISLTCFLVVYADDTFLLWPPCIADVDTILQLWFLLSSFFLDFSVVETVCLPYFHLWCGSMVVMWP